MKPRLSVSAPFTLLMWLAVIALASPYSGAMAQTRSGGGAELERILDEWAEALGGHDVLARVEPVHSLWAVSAYGLQGTLEEWTTADARHRMDLNLGGIFKMTVVSTATQGWILDHNNKLRALAGKEWEDEVRDVFLSTWSHLLPDRLAGNAKLLAQDPGAAELRVQILPAGGTEATFVIDPVRHLPIRWESPAEDGLTMVTTLAEWREVDGVLVPAKITQTSGSPESDVTMERQWTRFNESPPAQTFSRPEEPIDDVRFAAGRAARDIPLDISGVHLFVPVRVGDSEPLSFLLDTGAQVTILDSETAHDLGLELTGQISGSGTGEEEIEVKFVRNVSFQVPGARVAGQTVVATNLRDGLERAFGRKIGGILGYDFISRFVVEIDYVEQRLHLYDRDQWEYRGEGTELPIRIVDTRCVCDATIALPDGRSVDVNLYLDTGSSVAVRIHRPFTDENGLLSALTKTVTSHGAGLGGQSQNVLGRIASVKLGDLVFTDPICSFSRSDRGIGADATFAGKFGGELLERCTLTLDYERTRIFLEPNARFGTPFPGEMTGLSIQTGGRGDRHTFTVRGVIEGSPADEAGVVPGDVIVSVDGKPATELRMVELSKVLDRRDHDTRLELRRNDTIITSVLRARPML